MQNLQDLDPVVDVGWCRLKHQRTAIAVAALLLLLLLGLGGFLCLLLRLLLASHGEILDTLGDATDGVLDCFRHVCREKSSR